MDDPQLGKETEATAPLQGDVLDAVVSRVRALDLVPASRVSREWRRAVRSSVSSSRRLTPWLLLHSLNPLRSPSYAFDPHSRSWLPLPLPPHNNNNNNEYYFRLLLPVVACEGSRLCALSFSAMLVSADPFGAAAWRRFDAPRVWRQDPVVALVGPHLVVLGGACGLAVADEDDDAAASVEVLLIDSSNCTSSSSSSSSSSSCWQRCKPIPAVFYGSTSAQWLSAAASERRAYVVERRTGWASWFDPESRSWGPVRLLRPDGCPPDVSSWAAGGTDSLILIGVSGKKKKNFVKVHVWEVEGDSLEITPGRTAEMPQEMADRLFLNDDDDIQEEEEEECSYTWPCSIGLCAARDCGYVYNRAEPRKGMVMYEVERGDTCKAGMIRRWEWVPCPAALQKDHCYYFYAADKIALGCSAVGLDDLAACRPSR